MGLFDAFGFQGKRVLVVGGATGMGGAAVDVLVDAGAEVVVMDRADVSKDGVKFIRVDMSDKASIEAATDECGGPVHALLSCAGVADGTPGIERINFIGHRLMIDRMLEQDMLPRGSAIGMISSAAGMGWESNLDKIKAYLEITDFDDAAAWCVENGRADYMWSKQVMGAYVALNTLPLMAKGIRINAIMPGPTKTPLAQANAEQWLGFGTDYRDAAGIDAATPLDQAYPLVFLCSDAAGGVTGITMMTDAGFYGSGVSGSFPSATEAVKFLRGDYGAL